MLRFEYIPWGDERNQINLAIASGEYDFFPQGNFSDYQLMISRNAFLDIKPYLPLVPDLVAHYQQTGSEFRTMLAYLQKWYRDGILDKRLLTLSTNEGSSGLALFLSGNKPCETNNPIWSLNRDWIPQLTEVHPEWTYGFFDYDLGGRKLNYKSGASHGSVISISSRTKHPELAVRLLEKLHTDQRYYDLLVTGVEGVHYHLDDGVVSWENISGDVRYVGWTAAADSFLSRPVKYCNNDAWMEQVYLPHMAMNEKLTAEAVFHPLNDFHFNASPVSAQAVRLAETWNTYMMPLLCGLSENIDAELATAITKLEEAGLNEYLAEMQRQLTAFQQEKREKE